MIDFSKESPYHLTQQIRLRCRQDDSRSFPKDIIVASSIGASSSIAEVRPLREASPDSSRSMVVSGSTKIEWQYWHWIVSIFVASRILSEYVVSL
jgi:hypothetical protein